jgi:uncharacterized protein YcaQ
VQAVHAEPGVHRGEVADALADELRLMADWMQLADVAVTGAGDLAPELAVASGCGRSQVG